MLIEFFNKVKSVKSELNNNTIWFRGHSSNDFKLMPTVLREQNTISSEVSMFYEYKSLSATLTTNHRTNWDVLFDMQHYGVPTRLLDWTTSLGTALYFALKDNPISPCIWMLSPFELNSKSIDIEVLVDTTFYTDSLTSKHPKYSVHKIIGSSDTFDLPFAIQAPHGNRRISAQRGMFTVHGKMIKPIEELCPTAVRKVIIPLEIVDELKAHLTDLGIDDYSQFPDKEGLSLYLKNKYGKVKLFNNSILNN